MTNLIVREDQGAITHLILNRPESLNAINLEMFKQLRAHIENIAKAGSDVQCVILRGNGRAFSAGHDLNDIAGGEEMDNANYQAGTLELLATLPQPVIACVHGYCFTGALELALATDIMIVDEQTQLADTHSQWGLSPVWGMSQRLPRRVGHARAKDMMFSSRRVGATEAYAIGLVDKVFPAEILLSEVQAYAEQIVANSPHSNRVIKELLSATDGLRLNDGHCLRYRVTIAVFVVFRVTNQRNDEAA